MALCRRRSDGRYTIGKVGTGQAGVVLALLDRAVAQMTARDALIGLAREAVRPARDQHDTALENALAARIRA